ncbi:zebrafish testis-expressed 38 isoform X3 [Channa argus]|uniref:zebrafish testis-expressed 38 isoform X3 n=1 Tax=Channa argus TaxID=215402 RepID=UPI003521D6E0
MHTEIFFCISSHWAFSSTQAPFLLLSNAVFYQLQIVFIGVYTNPDAPNCIIESYQFKFRYTRKGPEMDIVRNNDVAMQVVLEDTKRASVLLIRKLFLLMQNLDGLPNNVYLTMKLYYYDEITPADYQPPGFKEGECDSLWFEGMAVHFKVGEVQTAFHSLGVCVSAEQGRLEKLQEGNHLREIKQVSQRNPPAKEMVKVGSEIIIKILDFRFVIFRQHRFSILCTYSIVFCHYKHLFTGSSKENI